MNRTSLSFGVGLLIVVAVSYFQYTNWRLVHDEGLQALMNASYSVLDGTPHWRAFQNRLLGPWLIKLLGVVADMPYLAFVKLGFAAQNLLLFFLIEKHLRSTWKAVLGVQAAAALWILQNHYWYYPWDPLESMSFMLFIHFVWRQRFGPAAWLVLVLSALNKETAAFAGLYLFLHGLTHKLETGTFDAARIRLGALIMVVSVALTEGLRHALFRVSSLDGVGTDGAHALFGNHLLGATNLSLLGDYLERPSTFFMLLTFYAVGLLVFAAHAWQTRRAHLIALSWTLLPRALTLGASGLLNEYRIYQPFMGGMVLLTLCLLSPPQGESHDR